MIPRPALPHPPATALLVVAVMWAAVVGVASAAVSAQPDLMFHLAVWVPLLLLLPFALRRGVETSWRWMALGLALFALGDVAWELIVAAGDSPDASWADIVYLSGYLALATGVALLLRDHGGPQRRDGLIDGILLAIPAAVLVAEFLVVPGDVGGQPLAVRIVTALYPLADTLLVAGVVWLLVTPGLARRVTALVATGLVATLCLDVVWAAASLVGNEQLTRWVDGLFPLSYALLAAGVALGATTPIVRASADRRTAVPWGRVVLLVTGLVAAPLTGVLGIVFHDRLQPVLVVAATLLAATLVVLRFVRLVNDLNRTTEELSHARNAILEQSVLDPLTGAYNRLVLPDQLEELSTTGPSSAVLSLDLDRFKEVNDRWGHHAGDVVLGAVAERLRSCTRDRDVVIRMGGDEFLIILHDVAPLDAVDLARRIVAKVEDPIEFQGQGLEVSASIGVAMVQRGGEGDTEALLHRADAAMYAAKRSESAVELAQP